MKKELREIIEVKELKILSERKNKAGDTTMRIIAPWMVAGRKNKNGRLYGLPLIQREVAKFQDRVQKGSAIGSADHPAGAFTTLDNASHIITKLEVDKSGKGWMEATILPTTKGKNVMTIVKAGGQLGISARGAGSISPNGTVESDYALLGIDIVTSPSEPEATFDKSNVFESQNLEEENDEQTEDREQVMYKLLQASYGMALNQGFSGDFDLYCTLHEKGLREVMALPANEKVPTQIIADAEQQIKDRTYGYFLESQNGGFRGTFDEWKEKFPKIVEQASEVRIVVEKKKEISGPFKSKTTWEEIKLSGFRGTMAEYEEKYPNITIIKPESPEKPVVETLDEEATRIYAGLKKANPNSSLQLEHVRNMLEKEYESKREKKIRELAIYRVNKSMAGSGATLSQEILEKMVAKEVESITEEKLEKKRKNWAAYKRLLSD